jgi:hypothetical protein
VGATGAAVADVVNDADDIDVAAAAAAALHSCVDACVGRSEDLGRVDSVLRSENDSGVGPWRTGLRSGDDTARLDSRCDWIESYLIDLSVAGLCRK